MIEIQHRSSLYPTYFANSVLEIGPVELQTIGITHVVFDLDETLAPQKADRLSELYVSHIGTLQKAGITVLIGTNTLRDVSEIAAQANVRVFAASWTVFKPRKTFFNRIIQATGTDQEHILVVGDRMINDVIAANRAGLRTVLVLPLARKSTPIQRWYTTKVRQHQIAVT